MLFRRLGAAAAVLAMTGCASVMNDVNHGVKVETKTAQGELVKGADCTLTNDYGDASVKSGGSVAVRRSSKDLQITCTGAQGEARGRAISRANAGMAGNIIIGGGIGALIDHNRGTAYTYPTFLQLVVGPTLVFDRRDDKDDGTPVPGNKPEVTAGKATGTAAE